MAKKIPGASIARYAAAIVAAIWAMLGLGNAYATGLGRGVDIFVIVAVVVNVALIIAAARTFVNARAWRIALIGTVVLVTLDRLLNVIGTGAHLTALSSVIILIVLVAIVLMSHEK